MLLNRRHAFPIAKDATAGPVARDLRFYKERKPKIPIKSRLQSAITGQQLIGGLLILLTTVLLLTTWQTRLPGARSLHLRQYYYYQDDGPPSSLIAVSKRTQFQKVPEEYRHKFYVADFNGNYQIAVRAFRSLGWKLTDAPEHAQFVYDKYAWNKRFKRLLPWQRYSQYPDFEQWENKYTFTAGILKYYEENPNEPIMIPETYLLDTDEHRKKFLNRLENQGGYNEPWVLKVPNENNAEGITMLGPNSDKLYNVSRQVKNGWDDYDDDTFYEENRLLIQSYTCNELTWYHNYKFDLRFYWMVASIDPLIVLFHDGCARVSGIPYNESDWSSTQNHLTFNTESVEEELGTLDQLYQRIHEYYNEHSQELSHIHIDPVQHVRNQLKASIAQTVAAFKDVFGNGKNHSMPAENAFQLNGADFVIDNNLDVWYIEPQAGPGMPEVYNFRVELHAELLCSMINITEEIQLKQEEDPNINLLPLTNLGNWEVVYVGDQWQYRYEGYKRPTKKQACGQMAVEASDVDMNVM